MGKLIYLITTSLDGYVADKNGNFNWAMPSEEVHTFVNNALHNIGTILMGHKLYETMKVWDDIPTEGTSGPYMDGPSQAMNDYSKIWHAAKKIIYSTTLTELKIENATIEHSFDPEAIQKMVAESDKDYDIAGTLIQNNTAKAGGSAIFYVSNDQTGHLNIINSTSQNNTYAPNDQPNNPYFETSPGIFYIGSGNPNFTGSTIK
jgi:dihydrofolate reductase